MDYDIKYEILDYDKLNKRLYEMCSNSKAIYPITQHEPLGYSKCGFPINHFSIGHGTKHIVYMGGAHGNEIIGVDYVTQLMNNISLGLCAYSDFDPNEFTIDFIPLQNPEGFYTTTYALQSIMKDMSLEETEKFSKDYYLKYRQDDINVSTINTSINNLCAECSLKSASDLIKLFWNKYRNKEITFKDLANFLVENTNIDINVITESMKRTWDLKHVDINTVIPSYKLHNEVFSKVTTDCIPLRDEAHKALKESLDKLYESNMFPMGTLANFFSNASGVNLNDNNEYFYNDIKNRLVNEEHIYAGMRDNNLVKDIAGPIGTPNYDMNEDFRYEPENIAIFDFLANQDALQQNYAFINCHGTGGLLYIYPYSSQEELADKSQSRNFAFYINNRLATEYTRETGKVYEERKGTYDPYKIVNHPERMTGVGDVLRKKYIASFILELSKAGGNPIGPYCDINGNYMLTMISNMDANAKMMKTILDLQHLYGSNYEMNYDRNGRVTYKVR